MKTVTYPEVLDAFRTLVATRSRWPLRDYEAVPDTAVLMGLDERPDAALTNMVWHAVTELVTDGTLMAVPRSPGGGVWFFTPASWDVWEATAIRAAAERENIKRRWISVAVRIEQAGYSPIPVRSTLVQPVPGGPVTLGLSDWERLLDGEAKRS